jgi:hypothetical protein
MNKRIIAGVILVSILLPLFSGCIDESLENGNGKPVVFIAYPQNDAVVFHLVMIHGTCSDANEDIQRVELRVDSQEWIIVDGTDEWSYEWDTFQVDDGIYALDVRAWDGSQYSDIQGISVTVSNPETVESDDHKWAVFIVAANFPEDNESKLGNGGLYLAEDMVEHFVEELDYPTSNVFLLFDDGWIRDDNGYGKRIKTLQERKHPFNITYGGATKDNVLATLRHVIKQSNHYRDSEVFLWIFNHGYGDLNNTLTGGKLFSSSWVFLWDDALRDSELGDVLGSLKSTKACIIVDACFCGGFAEKTILDLPTLFLFRSNIPQTGRIVISGTSKFRKGYASTLQGPIFSLLWFEGLQSEKADGYKAGFRDRGRMSLLPFFKDGAVSVEEAFYYAQYQLRTDMGLREFRSMQPQMNDRYPYPGLFLSRREMVLGS